VGGAVGSTVLVLAIGDGDIAGTEPAQPITVIASARQNIASGPRLPKAADRSIRLWLGLPAARARLSVTA